MRIVGSRTVKGAVAIIATIGVVLTAACSSNGGSSSSASTSAGTSGSASSASGGASSASGSSSSSASGSAASESASSAGTSGSEGDGSLSKITLASQRNATGFPIWLANKLGYFKENGLSVDIQYYASGAPALEAGISGAWQAGWIGAPPALTAGLKTGLISAGLEIEEGPNQVMMARKSDLKGKKPAELLKGAKVLVVVNSTSQQVLNGCLQKFGVPASDIQVTPLEPPAIVQAFESGQGTIAMSWSEVDFPLLDNPDYVKICDGVQAGVKVYCTFIVQPDFWKNKPDEAAAYIDAAYRANEFINDEPDKAAQYMLGFYKDIGQNYTLDQAKKALSLRNWYTLDQTIKEFQDGSAQKGLQATEDYFVDSGTWTDKPDVKKIVSTGLDVLKAAKQYRDKNGH